MPNNPKKTRGIKSENFRCVIMLIKILLNGYFIPFDCIFKIVSAINMILM
jgi:hypothetical protein